MRRDCPDSSPVRRRLPHVRNHSKSKKEALKPSFYAGPLSPGISGALLSSPHQCHLRCHGRVAISPGSQTETKGETRRTWRSTSSAPSGLSNFLSSRISQNLAAVRAEYDVTFGLLTASLAPRSSFFFSSAFSFVVRRSSFLISFLLLSLLSLCFSYSWAKTGHMTRERASDVTGTPRDA